MKEPWLKRVLEENRREVERWPDWKRTLDPASTTHPRPEKVSAEKRQK